MCRSRYFIWASALGALALAGCSDHIAVAPKFVLVSGLSADATKFWEASATVRWNQIARTQTLTHAISQQFGTRSFAYLSLAQFNAAVAAGMAKNRGDHASVAARQGSAADAVGTPSRRCCRSQFQSYRAAGSTTEAHRQLVAGRRHGGRYHPGVPELLVQCSGEGPCVSASR